MCPLETLEVDKKLKKSLFPLRLSERRLLLAILDLVAINSSLLLYHAIRQKEAIDFILLFERPLWFVVLSLIWFPLAYAFDAYDLRVADRFLTAFLSVLKAGIVTIAIYLLIPFITPTLPKARHILFSFFLAGCAFLLLGRIVYIKFLARPFFQRRAIVIGMGQAGQNIAKTLVEHSEGSYQVVGFMDDDISKREFSLNLEEKSPSPRGVKTTHTFSVLGDRYLLRDLIVKDDINTLILAIKGDIDGELLQILIDCLQSGVEIIPMPVLYEQLTGRVPIEHVGDSWYVDMPITHKGSRTLYHLVKRVMDIILSLLGIVFLVGISPFVILVVYIDSRGSIFYKQTRVGKEGRLFNIYKFRTMVTNAEDGEPIWASKDDPRVTRVGRFLRKTHIDELPQLLNILAGSMSFVGPRPERPEFVEEFSKKTPFYKMRHIVKPGVAGWGLVKQGHAASSEDTLTKLQYDLYYIKHQCLWLDIIISIKTILYILTLKD